ncbi:Acyltransferase boa11 [Clarireedia jacksonii]
MSTDTSRQSAELPESKVLVTNLTPLDLLMPRTYVIGITLSWPISRRVNIEDVYNHLKSGLKQTIAEIPFVGGSVVPTTSCGKFQIETLPEDFKGEQLIFNDLRSGSGTNWPHSYKSLRKAGFPCYIFAEECLTPSKRYLGMERMPVIAVQANFIDGGLILHLSVLHTACDAFAWSIILSNLSANVNASWLTEDGIEISPNHKLSSDSLDRSPLTRGNPTVSQMDLREYEMQHANSGLENPRKYLIEAPTSISEMEHVLFSISTTKLSQLRDHISATSSSGPWLTVSDALSGFLWFCINRARFRKSDQKPLRGNLSLASDGRGVLKPPLPATYLGNASTGFPVTLDIHPTSIYEAALAISEARNEFNDKYLRDLTGYLGGLDDITSERVMYAKTLDPILVISNLKDMEYHEKDWGGPLGLPDCIRLGSHITDFIPRAFPMPTQKDGTINLTIWIEQSAVKRLIDDDLWSQWIMRTCT